MVFIFCSSNTFCASVGRSSGPVSFPFFIQSVHRCRFIFLFVLLENIGVRESEAFRRESWRTNILRDHDFTVSQTEDQSSRVCSPCSNKVRSTGAEFYIIKTSFQESENDDDRFRRNVHISSWFRGRQGNSMAEMSASLIAWTWSLMILRNYDATNTTFVSFCLCFTAQTTGK